MVMLKTAQFFITMLTLFIAYMLTISPAGAFRAWVAKKMGDSLPEEHGFMSLNPLVHLDFLGLFFLFLFRFGWGRYIPISPYNIVGPHRKLKFALAQLSNTFAHIVLGVCAIIVFVLFFDITELSNGGAGISSFSVALTGIIWAFINLNVLLAMVTLIANSVMLLVHVIAERYQQYSQYLFYISLLLPLILIILLGEEVMRFLYTFILLIGELVARLKG